MSKNRTGKVTKLFRKTSVKIDIDAVLTKKF